MVKTNIPSKECLEELLELFEPESKLQILTEVPLLPEAGFSYIFEWKPGCRNEKDWRCDGYRWVQGATKTVMSKNGAKCTKFYFKTQVDNRCVIDDTFQKRAISCSMYPNRVLVRYLGDETSAKMFAHGNSKNTNKKFTRTKDSELQKLKMEKDKYPVKVYSEKMVEALVNNVKDERQKVDVVRNLKQVQNTMQRERVKSRLGDDEIYHLIELKQETDFIHDIVLSPFQIVTCFSKGKIFTRLFVMLQCICIYYEQLF
jgi:hypothetical protein